MPKIVILGRSFAVPAPYARGHLCTASEAESLNRLLSRTCGKLVHRLLDTERAPSNEEIALAIVEHARAFAQGGERLRAIEVEIARIAQSMVDEALYKRGHKRSDLGVGELEQMFSAFEKLDEVRAEAVSRVDTLSGIALAGLGSLA